MIAPWMIGTLIGLGLGITSWIVLGYAIQKRDRQETVVVDRRSKPDVLQVVRNFELISLPVIGGVTGHLVFGGAQ